MRHRNKMIDAAIDLVTIAYIIDNDGQEPSDMELAIEFRQIADEIEVDSQS